MSMRTEQRLPSSPYPGLRPFLDHEDALLFGRDEHAKDVIERLKVSCFVAVLGGSGSGKSSLVRAGVIPRLRRYGIKELGDLWIPVVFTPGTNAGPDSENTPLFELAKALRNACTKGETSLDAGVPSLAETVALLRERHGLANVVKRCLPHLQALKEFVPDEHADQRAKLMIVVDQFEELFDASNSAAASERERSDAEHLIDRLVDHFLVADGAGRQAMSQQQCFVIATMRSEHLGDCTAFPGLAEAINRAGYLVPRLQRPEQREAIERPLQRFLKMHQRRVEFEAMSRDVHDDGAVQPLPQAIEIDPDVVQRLQSDAERIGQEDWRGADHLPLLQHALARLWQVAERDTSGCVGGLPTRLTRAHLARAATGPGSLYDVDVDKALASECNVLDDCLNAWADAAYQRCKAKGRAEELDELLRNLGFKDPRNGTYNQQRVNVTADVKDRLLTLVEIADPLKPDATGGLTGHGDYLFLNKKDEMNITLKVQHEAVIRGWDRFKALVDTDAEWFDQWRALLKPYKTWVGDKTKLLSEHDLRRLEGQFLEQLHRAGKLGSGERWKRRLLNLDKLTAELDRVESLPGFLSASMTARDEQLAAQKDQEKKEIRARSARRYRRIGYTVAAAAVLFALLFALPAYVRSENLFSAQSLAGTTSIDMAYQRAGGAEAALTALTDAVDELRRGQAIHGEWWPPQRWLDLPPSGTDSMLGKASRFTEQLVQQRLRQLLEHSIWVGDKVSAGRAAQPAVSSEKCGAGSLYLAPDSSGKGSSKFGLLMTEQVRQGDDAREDERKFEYKLSAVEADTCRDVSQVLSIPVDRHPIVLAVDGWNYLIVGSQAEGNRYSLTLYRVDWSMQSGRPSARLVQVSVVLEGDALRPKSDEARLAKIDRKDDVGLVSMNAGKEWWRLPQLGAARLDKNAAVQADSPGQCESSAAAWRARTAALNGGRLDGIDVQGLALDGKCVAITTVSADQRNINDCLDPRNDRVTASLLPKEGAPLELARIEFGCFAAADKPARRFFAGSGKAYEGWLILQQGKDKGSEQWGAPVSTLALQRMGQALLLGTPPH